MSLELRQLGMGGWGLWSDSRGCEPGQRDTCVLVEGAVEGTAASSAGSSQAPRKTRIAATAQAPQATRGWWVRPGRLLVRQ